MIDQVTMRCTARAIEQSLEVLERVQSMLLAIEQGALARGDFGAALQTIGPIEIELAGVHGALSVVSGWLNPEPGRDGG